MREALERTPIVFISAPSGYGKTFAVRSALRTSDIPACWLGGSVGASLSDRGSPSARRSDRWLAVCDRARGSNRRGPRRRRNRNRARKAARDPGARGLPGLYTQVVVDAGTAGALVDTLNIATAAPTFFERVSLEAGDERRTWRVLRDGAIIYRVASEGDNGNTSVTFPATRSRWLRLRIYDLREVFPLDFGFISAAAWHHSNHDKRYERAQLSLV